VKIDNTVVSGVLSAEWSVGYDKRVAAASVTVVRMPSWANQWSTLTIAAGGSDEHTGIRFSGYITEFPAYAFAPRSTQITAQGPLSLAATPLVAEDTDDEDVPGMDLAGMTIKAQVQAVLDASGLAGKYSPALIGSTDHLLGTQTADTAKGSRNPNTWKRNQSGLAFLEERDRCGLGYRLVEELAPDGSGLRIVRAQIAPVPALESAVHLVEGRDLLDNCRASHTEGDTVPNRVVVVGFDAGSGPVKWIATRAHPHPPPGIPFVTYAPSTMALVEQAEEGDHSAGLSCQEVANWLIEDKCQVMLSAEIATPRDDFFQLTQSIDLYAPDRLEIAQSMWLRAVSGSVSAEGFRQQLSLRAPALVGRGGVARPQAKYGPGALAWGMPSWADHSGAYSTSTAGAA
jgi:hypothetical protein